jgi:hypothetical protein
MQALKVERKMTKAAKPWTMGRSGLLFLLFLCSVPSGANADRGGGVLGFLHSLEETDVEKETLWFYRFFGANLHPSKLNLAKDCDYDDPNKIQFCPPALNPMIYSRPSSAAGSAGVVAEKSLPSMCLEDPDVVQTRR